MKAVDKIKEYKNNDTLGQRESEGILTAELTANAILELAEQVEHLRANYGYLNNWSVIYNEEIAILKQQKKSGWVWNREKKQKYNCERIVCFFQKEIQTTGYNFVVGACFEEDDETILAIFGTEPEATAYIDNITEGK